MILLRLGSSVGRRCLHSKPLHRLESFQEVQYPVPWGHISGKWWGDQSIQPVVGLHGLLDNAATFDKLAPLLDTPSFLSLDLPGHGNSSHLPLGIIRHYYDSIAQVRYLLKFHLKWTNLTLLGHSYGSSVWFHYAGFYPEEVKKYISIDSAMFALAPPTERTSTDMRSIVESHLAIEDKKKNPPPEHEFEDLVEIMFKSRENLGLPVKMNLSRESCRTLLSRGAHKTPSGKYYFSRDLQLNSRSLGRSVLPFLFALAERMTCEILYIRASEGIIVDYSNFKMLESCDKSVHHMRKRSKRVEYVTIEGGHHLHLENPENVAPVINRFLNT